jgi:hypothetical protein
MDVDPLDRAAGLAAVEEDAVRQILDRVLEVGIGSDVGRVLAAQLEAGAKETVRSCFLNAVATLD